VREALVFASHRPPHPPTNGSRIRTQRLVTGLARAFDTTFLTFEHHPDSPDGHTSREELERVLPQVEIVTVPGRGPGKRLAQARTLTSRRSWTYGRYVLPRFGEALRDLVARRRPALVHLDDLGVGQFGPVPGRLTVFAPHNIEHRVIRGDAEVSRGVRRLYGEIEWRKLAREERSLWAAMPLCLAVSETDAETMRAGGAKRVEVCPNGTDPVAQLDAPSRGPGEPLRMLFLGSASYRPYENGIAWFVREVLPRIRRRVPAELDVVGRPPRRPMHAAGVDYVGPVESVTPWYERAHIVVVPVFEGSGTRLKIVEALAHGRPTISTHLGAQGLPIRPGEHYWQADDADGFATAALEVADRTERGDGELVDMLGRARAAISHLFWPAIVDRLVESYRHELGR
jgi:glycosyltransferase involved in cell wall biosynthesis